MSAAPAKSPDFQPIAIDCKNNGAMFAAAVNSCNGVADLVVIGKKKSKTAPPPLLKTVSVLDMKKRDAYYQRERLYKKLCRGNLDLAKLYEQILYVYQPKDGQPRLQNIRRDPESGDYCYWWGCTFDRWAERMDCTAKQIEYRFKLLRDYGLVASRNAKTPTNMFQVRALVAGGAASLNGWPDCANYVLDSHTKSLAGRASRSQNSELAISQNSELAISQNSEFKALDLAVDLVLDSKDLAGEQPPATAAHPGQNKNEPGKDKPRTQDQNLEPSQTQDQTQKSKPSLVLVKQGSALAQSSCSSNPLIDAWTTGMRGLGKHAQLTRIERAKIVHNFGQAATAAGVDGACVIRWALSKNVWWNIGVRLHVEHGVDQPTPAIFALTTAKFSNVIFDCFKAHLKAERAAWAAASRAEAAAALAALQAAQTVVAKPPPPPVEFPTEQQILADIAELVAQQKPKG